MKIRYSITTEKCPRCGYIFSEKNDFIQTLFLIVFFFIIVPIKISKFFLYKFIFKSPAIPTIGRGVINCPICYQRITTGKELKDFDKIELLNYKFNWLFKLSYFLGGIVILCLAGVIYCLTDLDYSIMYFVYIIITSVIVVSIIAITYRKMLSKI